MARKIGGAFFLAEVSKGQITPAKIGHFTPAPFPPPQKGTLLNGENSASRRPTWPPREDISRYALDLKTLLTYFFMLDTMSWLPTRYDGSGTIGDFGFVSSWDQITSEKSTGICPREPYLQDISRQNAPGGSYVAWYVSNFYGENIPFDTLL